jgi:hypothetical protein
MKKRLLPIITIQILLALSMSGFAKQKVLIVVNYGFNFRYPDAISNYRDDIINIEHKNVEVIPWIIDPGTNVQQCTAMLQMLQDEYVEARNAGDVLEGVVLIGDIPVPQYETILPPVGYGNMPLDQVYMDIIDNTGTPYTNSPFTNNGSFYDNSYNFVVGDFHYDIWVSRINAAFMSGIREGLTIYDEYSTYMAYLNRVKARMNEPASVPSRGFYMGGPEDHFHNIYNTFGQYLNELHLPWMAEFTGGHNSSFNWMSQLLAGPRGCINYGACNGVLYSKSERNRRICLYAHLPVVYEYGSSTPTTNLTINTADSLGWEWAGLYNHSCPIHTNFFSNDLDGTQLIKLNGEFKCGTMGPLWGSAYQIVDPEAYGGSYHYYQDYPTDPNPYNYGFGWKNKGAEWRWRVPPGCSGDYQIYLYYISRYENCVAVNVILHVVNVNASGLPISYVDSSMLRDSINQRHHACHPLPDIRWEKLFGCTSTVHLQDTQMAIVSLQLNDGQYGDHIVDAVRFICPSAGVDQIVDDDAQPGDYQEPVDNPSTIFSTTGFRSNDDVYRGFEDMGSEPGGGGFAKTQFFLTNACSINDFIFNTPGTLDKNVGNLYALGYNGLICMGTTTDDGQSDDKGPYTIPLRDGACFGQAFLAKINQNFGGRYALLGAGTLRAQPYAQFGSMVLEGFHVGNPRTDTTDKPMLIRNVTASSNWVVTSTHRSSSPFGTHSEIVIRPETVLSPTGINEIHLVAN